MALVNGGKSYLARRFVDLMPEHRTYCEPFIGGGSVLLNKLPADREIAGDLNADLVAFWSYLRDEPERLAWLAGVTPYTINAWNGWLSDIGHPEALNEPLDIAFRFLLRNRFSRGGLGKSFAWSDRLRGGQPGDANAWDTIRAEMPAIAERVKAVDFRCGPAIDLVREFDGPETLIFADPPYLPETRTAPKAYAHEMTRDQHVELLGTLNACRGAVMLSGYRSALYSEALAGWACHEFSMPNHSSQSRTKQRRVECLWIKEAGR